MLSFSKPNHQEGSNVPAGVLSAVGKTPLVRLQKICKDLPISLYAKLEMLNPGGSIKDRPAFEMVRQALETDEITRETVIVESSSGNMAIGLAQACCYYGLRFICVVDVKTTCHHVALLKAYGAEVEIVEQPVLLPGSICQYA